MKKNRGISYIYLVTILFVIVVVAFIAVKIIYRTGGGDASTSKSDIDKAKESMSNSSKAAEDVLKKDAEGGN